MQDSLYQKNIYSAIGDGANNIVVDATAGSGKTTTIKKGSELISSRKKILFLAFNKSIVEELKKKLPKNIEVSTLHSMGFRFLRDTKLNNHKDFSLAAEIATKRKFKKKKEFFSYCYNLCDMSNFVRVNFESTDHDSLLDLSMKYTLDISEQIEEDFKKFWQLRKNIKKEIDFTDMLYIPVRDQLVRERDMYDVIFVDEVQDLNYTQILFLEQLLKPNGRFIAVGDQWQSIYGFAGADHESFEKISSKDNTIKLPLSISYRCTKNIVRYAQSINPGIEYYELNEEGDTPCEGAIEHLRINDLVICRNNLPLLDVYFRLIANGVKATIVGKEIEEGLKKMVKPHNHLNYEDLLEQLDDDLELLYQRLLDSGYDNPQKTRRYIEFVEKIRCVSAITSYAKKNNMSFPILKMIEIIFTQQEKSVKLMTVHKSKGLESDRVFLILTYDGKQLMPSPYAQQDWEEQQEKHLQFVALTRAKKSLYFLYL